MKVICLIRHGHTEASERGLLNGWNESRLTDLGRASASALGRSLADEHFDSVWTSDLPRSLETARLAGWPDAVPDRRLRELDFGEWDRYLPSALTRSAVEELVRFVDFAPRHGESARHLRDRVTHLLDRLPEGRHAFFTHGGVIKTAQWVTGRCVAGAMPAALVEMAYP
jgi:broad specificity phosphatase PhoE